MNVSAKIKNKSKYKRYKNWTNKEGIMNPDNNNPFSNSGVSDTTGSINFNPPDPGSMPSPSADLVIPNSDTSMSPVDSLTSTSQELQSMALHGADLTSSMGMHTEGNPNSTTPPSPTPDLPLTPAAPVPGSIGSAKSVPLADTTTASSGAVPSAEPLSSTSTHTSSSLDASAPSSVTASSTSTPLASSVPYNPFMQPPMSSTAPPTSSSPTTGVSAGTTPNGPAVTSAPAFQPIQPATPSQGNHSTTTASQKSTHHSPVLVIIMGVALAVAVVVAIIFAILYFKVSSARDASPVSTTTTTPAGEISQSEVKEISCVLEEENGNGSTVILNYVGDQMRQISLSSRVPAESEEAAATQRDILEAQRRDTLNLAGLAEDPYDVTFTVEGNNVSVNASATSDQLTSDEVTSIFMLSSVDGEVDTSKDGTRKTYENLGFVCSE